MIKELMKPVAQALHNARAAMAGAGNLYDLGMKARTEGVKQMALQCSNTVSANWTALYAIEEQQQGKCAALDDSIAEIDKLVGKESE